MHGVGNLSFTHILTPHRKSEELCSPFSTQIHEYNQLHVSYPRASIETNKLSEALQRSVDRIERWWYAKSCNPIKTRTCIINGCTYSVQCECKGRRAARSECLFPEASIWRKVKLVYKRIQGFYEFYLQMVDKKRHLLCKTYLQLIYPASFHCY